jgi:hypothetical protein
MGYSTDFEGRFKLSRPATAAEVAYINKFANTRRMRRNTETLYKEMAGKDGLPFVFTPTPAQAKAIKVLEKSGLQVITTPKDNTDTRDMLQVYGQQGEYYVGDDSIAVLDQDSPSSTQPGLWCQWILSKDGTELMWYGGEKFYEYVAWLEYLIKHFFAPWGIVISGSVRWGDEDSNDKGTIKVTKNVVTSKQATIKWHIRQCGTQVTNWKQR